MAETGRELNQRVHDSQGCELEDRLLDIAVGFDGSWNTRVHFAS